MEQKHCDETWESVCHLLDEKQIFVPFFLVWSVSLLSVKRRLVDVLLSTTKYRKG